MAKKRDLLIAVLVASCLTATLFMVVPIRSNLGEGDYNPWADINSDGTVDIYDAIMLAEAFGASGTAINKSASLADLQLRIDRIEQFLNQTAKVEFLFNSSAACEFGVVGFWNASKLVAESITDKINSTISGLRNCTLYFNDYYNFFVDQTNKGYYWYVDFRYDRATPPAQPLTPDEIETVRANIEEYLAKP